MLYRTIKKIALGVINLIAKRFIQTMDLRKNLKGAIIIENKINHTLNLNLIHTTSVKLNPRLLDVLNLDDLFYLQLKKGDLVGNGIILTTEGKVLLESTIFQEEYLFKLGQNHLILSRMFVVKKTHPYTVLSLSNALEDNYYHWIMESITRVLLLEDLINIQNTEIVINDSDVPFKVDSLAFLFGIPRSNVKLKGAKEVYQGPLIIPSFTHTRNQSTEMTDISHPYIIHRLNQKVTSKLQSLPKKQFPSKFILSRRNASGRKILNEQYLLDGMEDKEFRIIEMEDLSFEDQVHLFYNSQFVIATHGAGLANIVFSKKITVIELFPADRNSRDAICFAQLSSVLGFHHHLIGYPSSTIAQDVMIDSPLLNEINSIIRTAKII